MLPSDVVLPGGVSGPAFATTVLEQPPQLPIIFRSGYATKSAKRDQPTNTALLNKPICIEKPAHAISTALS